MRTPRRALALSTVVLFWSVCASGPAAAQTSSLIHSFSNDAGQPQSGLVLGDAGVLYGTTQWGGSYGLGSVYTLTPDGLGGYTTATLYSFRGDDGSQPVAALLLGGDGLFYGTTSSDTVTGFGTVFRIDAAGTLTTLHVFDGADGAQPMAALAEAFGALYGTTSSGAQFGNGEVFRIDLSGANFSLLYIFGVSPGSPGRAGVVINGNIMYGTTYLGGHASGLVYSMDLGGGFTPIHDLTGDEGRLPDASLVFGPDGALYGTARAGGQFDFGTAFRMDTAGNFTRLHSFVQADGSVPSAPLVSASDGMLYGTASAGGEQNVGTVFRITTGGDFEVLLDLDTTDSRIPLGGLLEVETGVLYGTSVGGGNSYFGTVFRVDTAGTYETLHDFAMFDGRSPTGALAQTDDGTLWGATMYGGAFGIGTAFSLDPSGTGFTTLHGFSFTEGGQPNGPPIPDPDGNFYGVTQISGAHHLGAFYRMSPTGQLTSLHDITAGDGLGLGHVIRADDGNYYGATNLHVLRFDTSGNVTPIHDFVVDPFVSQVRVMQGSDSALYGMTSHGGAYGEGSVFRLALDGTFTTLHDLSPSEGSYPYGGLVEANDGNFYGAASAGGQFGSGFVFRVTPAGQFRIIYSFGAPESGDALQGENGLIQASDGFLYGTSTEGGHSGSFLGAGAVFRLDLQGSESVIHSFAQGTGDGYTPTDALLESADGLLYGTTDFGGQYGGGAIFRVDPSTVIPILSISPTSGPALAGSTAVQVTGTGFQDGARAWMGTAEMTLQSVTPTVLSGMNPALTGGTLLHVAVVNPDGSEGSLARAYFADFFDVPQQNIFHAAVERILRDGITSGCGSGYYCGANQMTRAQMAIFLLRALNGGGYTPPPATGTVFADVAVDTFAASWIEDAAARGITAGCGGGDYCPDAPVTRAQMAVFLLKTLLGSAYVPPDPTGTVFGDVPADAFAAAWIEDLAGRGITGGCQASPPLYCPATANTRAQMAAFLVNTFGLP